MKLCNKCKRSFNLDDFYKSKNYKDGHLPTCKECYNKKLKEWRQENKEKARGYVKKCNLKNIEKKKARDKAWREKNPNYYKKYQKTKTFKEYQKKYKYKHIEKHKARQKMQKLVARGGIKRLPCQICGEKKTEFHHPDYNYFYKVIHLCKKCHYKVHKNKLDISYLKIYNYKLKIKK